MSSLVHFPARLEYVKWSLDNVKEAHARWQRVMKARHKPLSSVEVTKREFWEIFTDYTTMTSEGSFLALPMDQFEMFDFGPGRVFILEPLTLLTLFCDGVLDEKISFIFELFDFEKRGRLVHADMVMLIEAVTAGAHKLGIVENRATIDQVEDMALDMFRRADTNLDETVSVTEFVEWAHTNVESLEMLRHFKMAKNDAISERATLTDKGRKVQSKIRGAVRRASLLSKLRSTHEASTESREKAKQQLIKLGLAKADMENGKGSGMFVSEKRRQSHAKAESGVAATLAAASDVHEDEFDPAHLSVIKREAKRTRDRKLKTIASRKLLSDLAKATRFTPAELKSLAHRFTDASAVTGTIGPVMFTKIMETHFPSIVGMNLVESLFTTFDHDKNGKIDFREFCVGLSKIMRGSVMEKMELVFQVYDSSGDGDICIVELIYLVKAGAEELEDVIEFSEDVMASLDENGDGDVDLQEFLTALSQDQGLLESFTQSTAISRGMARALHGLQKANSNFNATKFQTLWASEFLPDRAALTKPMDRAGFTQFFRTHFDCTEEHDKHVTEVWSAFDPRETGEILPRDLLLGFVQVFTPRQTDKAAFLFEMYDNDASGTLDRNEVLHMLLSAQEKTNRSASVVIQLLRDLDVDGDGRITLEEFKATAVKQPLLLESMEKIFSVRGEIYDVLRDYAVTRAGTHKPRRKSMTFAAKGEQGGLFSDSNVKPHADPAAEASAAGGAGAAAAATADAGRPTVTAAGGAGGKRVVSRTRRRSATRAAAAARRKSVKPDLIPLSETHKEATELLRKMDELL